MIITLEEYLKTDAYKKAGKSYYHPQEIVDMITKNVSDIDTMIIEVDKEGGAKLDDGTNIITFGRGYIDVSIKTKSAEIGSDIGLTWHIGLLYSYDSSVEKITVFEGAKISACTNLCIFNAENIYNYNLKTKLKGSDEHKNKMWSRKKEDVMDLVVERVREMSNNIDVKFKKVQDFISKLNNSYLWLANEVPEANPGVKLLNTFLGQLYREYVLTGKFDYSTFNFGCQLLFDDNLIHENKSLYAVHTDEHDEVVDNFISAFTVYSAMTQRITDRRILIDDVPVKTLEIDKAFSELLDI